MSNDDPTTNGPSGDTSSADFDSALIPHEQDEESQGMSANRAKADADSEAGPDTSGSGDESTDPNAQPPS